MLVAQGCFYHPYYKDKDIDWWYFEDWDLNQDRVIDKSEFTMGFEKHKMINKISSKQDLAYSDFDSLVVKMTRNTGEHKEDKAKGASLDLNGDQKISETELATGMFSIADDNRDEVVSGVEFYVWEVYL